MFARVSNIFARRNKIEIKFQNPISGQSRNQNGWPGASGELPGFKNGASQRNGQAD
jgi:hypothetical protein